MLKALFYSGDVPFDHLFIPAIYHEIYYDSIYLDIMNVLDKTKEDCVIVDVGANIGITVQHFREHAKRVLAVEPSTEHFEALSKNKEFNKWDNVDLVKCAISEKDGEATLNLHKNNRTSHSLAYARGTSGSEVVKTKTLMTLFKENNIDHVDFMKFDVEGAEEAILPSKDFAEASKIIDNVMIEFHFPNFPEHVNRLIKLGYSARRYPCSAVIVDFNK